MIDVDKLLLDAKATKAEFAQLIKDIPYERKGILFSEMFFMFLCAEQYRTNNILESGRARGQSTLVLANIFPDKNIASIEHDPNSVDVDIAYNRLKGCKNVRLMFGNSIELLPQIANKNDVVLIDGPKGYRSLRLAFKLLNSGKFPLVFIHDTTKGTSERNFLCNHVRNAVFSDDLEIASITSSLDHGRVELRDEFKLDGEKGYGMSLACLPFDKHINYKYILFKAAIRGSIYRWFKR